jgi:integrase
MICAPSSISIVGMGYLRRTCLFREVLSGNIWAEVVNLPAALLKQGRALKGHAPIKAAVLAQIGAAIAILAFAPVRLSNLVRARLDENLIKPGGIDNPYWLVFPDYDVKNRVPLEFRFDPILTDFIDKYVNECRPVLLRESNEAWLFPGEAGGFKTPNMFSTQITENIQKAIGLRITVHQFRHAAAAVYLRHRPGEYESVRRLLGHRQHQDDHELLLRSGDHSGDEDLRRDRAAAHVLRSGAGVKDETCDAESFVGPQR